MERIVLTKKEKSMVGYRWTGNEPKDLNDIDLAVESGAVWEGDELVAYDTNSFVWQIGHMGDDYMIDND